MVNSEEFASRLQLIMDHYHLNGSAFAESIGVQRSAISHILSGRNKPSLEFVMKILETYPDIELYWLLNGKGNSPFKKGAEAPANDLFSKEEYSSTHVSRESRTKEEADPQVQAVVSLPGKRVKKVLIFYDDNTFEEIVNLP